MLIYSFLFTPPVPSFPFATINLVTSSKFLKQVSGRREEPRKEEMKKKGDREKQLLRCKKIPKKLLVFNHSVFENLNSHTEFFKLYCWFTLTIMNIKANVNYRINVRDSVI